jgi:hypothetical protein
MPLLADPEIGAWYPLNWPFFLTGISARSIEGELAVHAAIACFGAWLLALDLLESAEPALLAAIFYGFSGFFAAHSSHVGMFQGAALFPWLLWSFRRAILQGAWRYAPVCAAIGAALILAGHFQTALYCFFGLSLFALYLRRLSAIPILAGIMAAVIPLSAITWLPALELASQSVRAPADFHALVPGALLTLFFPNFFGAIDGKYTGPAAITQFYFYAGMLLVPLALWGLLSKSLRLLALAMLVPTVWYALGPSAGLYRLVALLPGFRSVQAPVEIWFVAALVLALLAAGGAQALAAQFRQPWLVLLIAAFTFVNVYVSNMEANPLAYARSSFESLYGNAHERFDGMTETLHNNPLHRFWAPADSNAFGPLNGAPVIQLETTYGYNPFELQAYHGYMEASLTNPKLLNGLSVTHKLDLKTGQIVPNPDALPRATFPAQVLTEGSLSTLDPAKSTLLQTNPGPFHQDPHATANITNYESNLYKIHYTAATPSILRISSPYFPGWNAQVDGVPAPVFRLDQALCGVLVPSGTHELIFRFNLTWLTEALIVSISAWLVLCAALMFTVLAKP